MSNVRFRFLVLAALLTGCGMVAGPQRQDEAKTGALSGASVSTDHASYSPGATVTVTYAGLAGNAKDWIAIAPAGSAVTSYVAWVFTGGQTSGTATFPAPAAGSFVARTFDNNTFTLAAESATFTVGGATISSAQSAYAVNSPIQVSYAGLPGNAKDWIAMAPAGSPVTSYVSWLFTNGQTAGNATFATATPGTYVVRAFSNNTFTLIAESPPFTVGTGISTDATGYYVAAPITVTYSALPGNPTDWIAMAPAGSPVTSYVAWQFTNGQTAGSATFSTSTPGTYVMRAFSNNTFTLIAESPPFTVTTMNTGLTTDAASYFLPATITVTYSGLPGNAHDWVDIAPAGSALTAFTEWKYTNGQISGTATFSISSLHLIGSYVARTFSNDSYTLIAESAPFSVVPVSLTTSASTYVVGGAGGITVTFSGMPGNAMDSISIDAAAILPDGCGGQFQSVMYTNGAKSGTLTFPVPTCAGPYLATARNDTGLLLLGHSAQFTVVVATISPSAYTYVVGDTITAYYSNMPGNPGDAIVLASDTAGTFAWSAIVPTNGQSSGSATFTANASGVFQVRALTGSSFPPSASTQGQRLASSSSFTVF